ncbi:MAG TPA: hypothetical protein VEH08_02925 [Methanomassiliicoccales archaeon]|nr:hypothetical protein [Methanomassiliicoccales archaeon]
MDGIDGSGKSTHARWIEEYYRERGEKVLVRIHPSERISGKLARRSLEERGAMMRAVATVFFIGDVLLSVASLRRDSRRYDTIVYVRYLMATAYLPEKFMFAGYDFFSRMLPVPERLLLVDVQPLNALKRILEREHRLEMFEDLPSLKRARSKVLRLARPPWQVLDNNAPEGQAHRSLVEILRRWDETLTLTPP